VEVETKHFVRFKINNLLQVDFVNDISARYGNVIITEDKYIIDSIENILSNKLSAVIGRDYPKDILLSAHEKAGFSNEDLIIHQ
jgi:predicted ribosome quality control (RQC) complex YloA/Tae2 family protein